jgi:hypothetical protein
MSGPRNLTSGEKNGAVAGAIAFFVVDFRPMAII